METGRFTGLLAVFTCMLGIGCSSSESRLAAPDGRSQGDVVLDCDAAELPSGCDGLSPVCDAMGQSDDGQSEVDVAGGLALARWQAFGGSHVALSIDNVGLLYGRAGCLGASPWVSSYEVSVIRSNQNPEVVLQGELLASDAPATGQLQPRLTQVAMVAAGLDEEVQVCLTMFDASNELFASGCQATTLKPGWYGQLVWQLSEGTCDTAPLCYRHPVAAVGSELLPNEPPSPTLYLMCTLDPHHDTGAPPGKQVGLSLLPKVPCSEGLAWFHGAVPDAPTDIVTDCVEGPDWTEIGLALPTIESALGLFHELLLLPGSVPQANLVAAAWDDIPDTQPLVGLRLMELGTAQAQWNCEPLYCDCGGATERAETPER